MEVALTRPDRRPSASEAIPGASADGRGHATSTIARNFVYTFFGNTYYAACQWFVLVALARSGSAETVGEFALALALAAPVCTFLQLHLRAVIATDARDEYLFADYLWIRVCSGILALATVVAIAYFTHSGTATVALAFVVTLFKVVDGINDVVFGAWQKHERMGLISGALAANGTLLVLFVAALAPSGRSLYVAIGWLISSCLTCAGAFIVRRQLPTLSLQQKYSSECWRRRRRLITVALPLGVVMTLVSLNANVPRYFLQRIVGVRELGMYAALAYLLVAGNTVVNALGQSATPRLARYWAAGDRHRFARLLASTLIVGFLLGAGASLCALLAGRQVLSLIYGPAYGEETVTFLWICIAGGIGFVASFLGYGVTAARYFKVQAPLMAIVTFTSAASAYLLIPRLGLLGAALAGVAASLTQVVGTTAVLVVALRTARQTVNRTCA